MEQDLARVNKQSRQTCLNPRRQALLSKHLHQNRICRMQALSIFLPGQQSQHRRTHLLQ